MNFLQAMNEAIEYIEAHLTESINLSEAVRNTGYTYSYFQRVFSCIAGMTTSEYIRKRKMTLAAVDLKENKERVIDVALKYGYDSADAFSRAFMTFHGITEQYCREIVKEIIKYYQRS